MVEQEPPRFAQPIPNITVAVGRDANMPCLVENLGIYKVSNLQMELNHFLDTQYNLFCLQKKTVVWYFVFFSRVTEALCARGNIITALPHF